MPDDVRPVEDAFSPDEDMIAIGEDDPDFPDLPDELHERLASLDPVWMEDVIREAEEDIKHGRTRPAREVFDELRAKYGIPR